MAYLLFQILLIILAVIAIYWELQLFVCDGAPFLVSSNETSDHAQTLLDIKPNENVYDLGCGNCKMLLRFRNKSPDANYIGIDQSPFAQIAAKLNIFVHKANKNVQIEKGDFMSINVSNADKIYLWLSPTIMPKLYAKFKKELKQGTKVVSCDFPFENEIPIEIVETNSKRMFGKRLYLYVF